MVKPVLSEVEVLSRDLHLGRIVCKVGRVRSLLNDVDEALPRIMGADDLD